PLGERDRVDRRGDHAEGRHGVESARPAAKRTENASRSLAVAARQALRGRPSVVARVRTSRIATGRVASGRSIQGASPAGRPGRAQARTGASASAAGTAYDAAKRSAYSTT